ncbi:MAG: YdeI/OmpD-associated family protein [Candidatus Acidiferrales bacterium]
MLAKAKQNPHHFLATIYKIWMMRHVDVPAEIADALIAQLPGAARGRGGKSRAQPRLQPHPTLAPKHIPVVAAVNHCVVRTTLVPAGAGRYRMQINTALRRAAGGADAGDVIGVSLRLDLESREVAVPAELRATLKAHPQARKEFARLPSGHRRQLLLYYLRAKSSKARAHAIERILDHLRERTLLRQTKPKAKPKAAARPR